MGRLLKQKYDLENEEKANKEEKSESSVNVSKKVAMNYKEFDFLFGKIKKKQQYYITEMAKLPEGKL